VTVSVGDGVRVAVAVWVFVGEGDEVTVLVCEGLAVGMGVSVIVALGVDVSAGEGMVGDGLTAMAAVSVESSRLLVLTGKLQEDTSHAVRPKIKITSQCHTQNLLNFD